MSDVLLGFATLIVVFILVIVLGVQIQITSLSRRIDEVLNRLPERGK